MAGLFLLNTVLGDDVAGAGAVAGAELEADSPVGGLGIRSRNGDEGDDGVGEEEEEDEEEGWEGLRWDRDRDRASGEERMEGLFRNRDDDGENTGELETATEQDILILLPFFLCFWFWFLMLLFLVFGIFLVLFFCSLFQF